MSYDLVRAILVESEMDWERVTEAVGFVAELWAQIAPVVLPVVAGWLVWNRSWALDWMTVKAETWCLQLRFLATAGDGLLSWPETQYQIWRLLQLEGAHRMDVRSEAREGRRAAALPHVDTQSNNSNSKSNSKQGSGMGDGMASSSSSSSPVLLKRLVLIGGGHAHAYTLKNLGMKPLEGVQVTLVTRDVLTPYSGMLPGHVAGQYTREECHIDLMRLARFANVTLVHATACGLDRENKHVLLDGDRPSIPYDIISIDIGSAPGGLSPHAAAREDVTLTPVKPIDGFSARWTRLVERVVNADAPMELVVVGGGAGGVELCLSMQARLQDELTKAGKSHADLLKMRLITRSKTVMTSHNKGVQKAFTRILAERNVVVETGCEVVRARQGKLVCADGREVKAAEVVWCTQASAQAWLRETGLALDERGFIKVNEKMQSVNDPDVFACGDVASLPDPRPKAGVFAVRAGPVVTANLRKRLLGVGEWGYDEFLPQKSFLGIIGTGRPELCVASKGSMVIEAAWLWELKDWIDRVWMHGYTTGLPLMGGDVNPLALPGGEVAEAAGPDALAALAHASMRCGGCGAKVGATVLSRVMARLREDDALHTRPEVLVGLDAPDDCAVVTPPMGQGQAMVHTVDFFRSFIGDAYVFGQIAANHALSDCHAMCAQPVTALAMAVVPFAVEAIVEDQLHAMMAGACKALKASGCALVGGHTCEGRELSLGFAVNGVCDRAQVLSKGGLKAGQRIILTKAVGTGTLFAAEMRLQAHGEWVSGAIASMLQSNQHAALCLRDHGASACTDVTGFGVMGHLVEMLKASPGCGATLSLSALPALKGAKECVAKGIFSSLQPANLRLKRAVANEEQAMALDPLAYPLLFDPQTAGGLMASVPSDRADECVRALRDLGFAHACVLGEVTPRLAKGEDGANALVTVLP